MSRRYGRNQKRAARDKIASLEFALAAEAALSGRLSRQRSELVAAIDRARKILGENSYALPPKTIRTDHGGDFMARSWQAPSVIDWSADYREETISFKVTKMLSLAVRVGKSHDGRTHVQTSLGNGGAGYAISEEALLNMPAPILKSTLIPQIARAIAEQIVKGREPT